MNNKKPNRVFLSIILIILIASAIIFLLTSPIFLVKTIDVEGNTKFTKEEIINLSYLKTEKNIFIQRYLKSIYNIKKNPRILNVYIKFGLPNHLTIKIEEREEHYQLSTEKGYYIIDDQGYILKRTDEKQKLVMLKGLTTKELEKKERLDLKDLYALEKMNKVYNTIKSLKILDILSEIELTNKNYILKFDSEKKIAKIETNLNDIRSQLLKIKEVILLEKGKEGEIFIDKNDKREYTIFKEKI